MASDGGIEVVRQLDQAAIAGAASDERLVQRLVAPGTGTGSCTVSWIRTPPGGGSPEGLHAHPVDQIFYLLEGRMSVEVHGSTHVIGPGTLVLLPAGIPHRNWNDDPAPSVHLAINVPEPPPNVPFVRHIDPPAA